MKLESFGISNFKAFGQSLQRMPLKPLTLIFGANSAGKLPHRMVSGEMCY